MFNYMNAIEQFGLLVAQRRESLGLTQEEVGDICGLTKQSISILESGKVKQIMANTLIGLSKALKWSPEQIFLAYQGKDPDAQKDAPDQQQLFNAALEFAKHLPQDVLMEALGEETRRVFGKGIVKRGEQNNG